MSEALSYPEESRVPFETSASEFAPDLSDREFLTEEEKRVLIGRVQAGLDAQTLLKNDDHELDRAGLQAEVEAGSEAENLMVQTHVRLAVKIANAHYATSMTPDDLFQHAGIGLLKAVRTFDLTKNAEFKKYASLCIREEVRKYIAITDRMIDIPENEFWLARKIPGAQEEFKQKNGRMPTDEELAKALKARVTQITDLRPVVRDAIAVLDAPLNDGSSSTLKDRLMTDDESPASADHDNVANPRLKAALDKLPESKRKFILMRYGLEGYPNMHPEDISREFGVAPRSLPKMEERIRRHLRVLMDSEMGDMTTDEAEASIDEGEANETINANRQREVGKAMYVAVVPNLIEMPEMLSPLPADSPVEQTSAPEAERSPKQNTPRGRKRSGNNQPRVASGYLTPEELGVLRSKLLRQSSWSI